MSIYVEFNDSLVTGNEIIDGQHKELIEKINKLIACCEDGGGKLEAIRMLDYLTDYTDFHFTAEEKLQEAAAYPGMEEHVAKHNEFRKAVEELTEMLNEEEGPSAAFVDAVKKNVADWFVKHIQGFDTSVASYIHMAGNSDRL